MINARAETLTEKPAYRGLLSRLVSPPQNVGLRTRIGLFCDFFRGWGVLADDEEAFVCFNYPLHLGLLVPRADEKQVRVVPDSLVRPHRDGDALGARVVRAFANELSRRTSTKIVV